MSFYWLIRPHHAEGWVLIRGMAAVVFTTAPAAASHAGPTSPGSVPAALPTSVDGIQALDPKGFYATFSAGAGWPQPVHDSDDSLSPRLPIRGEEQHRLRQP